MITALAAGAMFGYVVPVSETTLRSTTLAVAPDDPAQIQQMPEPTISPSVALHWSALDSDDARQFVSNLRAVGCPESTISHIVRARVLAKFNHEKTQLKPSLAKYWSTVEELARMNAAVSNLAKARDEFLYTELGLARNPEQRQPKDGIKARAREAFDLYPRVNISPDSTEEERQRAKENRMLRLNYLSQYLTAEELLDYRLNQDGTSGAVDALLRGISPTAEEFKRVFQALDGEELRRTNGSLRPDLEVKLRAALGEDRYAAYREESLPENELPNLMGFRFDLSKDQVRQLKELQKHSSEMAEPDYRKAVGTVLGNPTAEAAYFSDPRWLRLQRTPQSRSTP